MRPIRTISASGTLLSATQYTTPRPYSGQSGMKSFVSNSRLPKVLQLYLLRLSQQLPRLMPSIFTLRRNILRPGSRRGLSIDYPSLPCSSSIAPLRSDWQRLRWLPRRDPAISMLEGGQGGADKLCQQEVDVAFT